MGISLHGQYLREPRQADTTPPKSLYDQYLEETKREAPGVLARTGERFKELGNQLMDDPLGTLGSMAKSAVVAPVKSFMDTFATPVEGDVIGPNYAEGKIGAGMAGVLPVGTRITKENTPEAITRREQANAAMQTLVNAAVPGVASRVGGAAARFGANKFFSNAAGTTAAGTAAGAAYDPSDPLVGGIVGGTTGAVLGTAGPLALKGAGKVASGVIDEFSLRPSGKSATEIMRDALKMRDPLGIQAQSATPTAGSIFNGRAATPSTPSAPTPLQRFRASSGRVVERTTPIETSKTRALREVSRAFSADKGDNVTMADALAFADRAGDKPIMPLDLGAGNVAGLARMAKDVPGLGRRLIPEALHARSRGASLPEGEGATLQRITSDVERRIGLKPEDYFRSIADMTKEMKSNAATDYGAIRNTLVDDPEVLALFDVPEFRSVHERVRTNARVAGTGEEIPPLGEVSVGDATIAPQRLGTLDKVKRQLDKIIEGKAEGGPIDRDLAYSMRARLNEILDRLDTEIPEYGAARNRYRGSAEAIGAYEEGKADFLKVDPRAITQRLEQLPDRLKDLYRRGGYDALRTDKLMKMGDEANIGDALLKNPDIGRESKRSRNRQRKPRPSAATRRSSRRWAFGKTRFSVARIQPSGSWSSRSPSRA